MYNISYMTSLYVDALINQQLFGIDFETPSYNYGIQKINLEQSAFYGNKFCINQHVQI